MCVLYVRFGSKVRPKTFGSVAMCSALLFILRLRLIIYSAGSALNIYMCLDCCLNNCILLIKLFHEYITSYAYAI